MKFSKLFQRKSKVKKVADFYQDSIQKIGQDQIKKLADKGLSIPIFLL